MSTIDQRVVEMQFNNKQFENGVQTSLQSLDKLKKGLDLSSSAKSLNELDQAGKRFTLAGMAEAIKGISDKFSSMGIIGISILNNLTTTAFNAGKRIVSSLTIDPIKMGLKEYETQLNAIQTVLANTSSKGTTLTDVNEALNQLNEYSDKTIYNFTEMARNIGTFTAAGVDLDTSVNAIKGIANLAAVSGSSSQQASTAMYQLSQALASGTVKLMDWNSVVNAGMGGQVFQDALKDTARVHGVKIDEMIKKEGSFRNSLDKGWLTSAVLTETLSKFTGDLNEEQLKSMGYTADQVKEIIALGKTATDAATKVKTFTQLLDTLKESVTSGWAQSWSLIIGDFEEAKTLWTGVSNVIGGMLQASAQARIDLLKGWKDLGGRTSMLDGIKNAFDALMLVMKPIQDAFREIFPRMTADQLFKLTEGFKKFTAYLKIGEGTAAKLKSTFKGIFALLDIGRMAVSALAEGFVKLVRYFVPAGDGLLGITGGIGNFIVSIRDAIKAADLFGVIMDGLESVFAPIGRMLKNFVKGISDAFKALTNVDMGGVDEFTSKFKGRFAPFEAMGKGIKVVFEKLAGVVEKLMPVFYALGTIVSNIFNSIKNVVADSLSKVNYKTVLDLLNGGLLAGILLGIKSFMGEAKSTILSGGGILDGITKTLDSVRNSLSTWQTSLKAGVLLKIAIALGILAASVVLLSTVDSAKLASSLAAMSVLFAELFGSMAVFEKVVGSKGFKGMQQVTRAMIPLAASIFILTLAMKNLAELDWDELRKGLLGVAVLSATLVASAKVLQTGGKKLIKGASGLIIFAGAILLLTLAVERMGALKPEELAKGLVGVGVLCLELAAFLKLADLDKMGIRKGGGLMLLAVAINILATAVKKFGSLSVKQLTKGLGAMGLVLAQLAIFTRVTAKAKHVVSTAIGLTIIAGAMLIFAEVIERMGALPIKQIGKGLIALGGSLAIIAAAMWAMPKNMIVTSLALLVVAGAINILALALEKLGGMTIEQLKISLIGLAGALGIIAAAMWLMTGALPGAAALLIVAGALAILAPILLLLGGMAWEEIGKGLFAIAGVFLVIGAAALILAPATIVILAISAAVALFGIACLAVGAGVLAFAAGLTALAAAGTVGAAALVIVVTSLLGLIPVLLEKMAEGVIAFAKVIEEGAPAIVDAIMAVAIAMIDMVTVITPKIVDCVINLLLVILEKLAWAVPQMVDSGMKIILGILKGIADNIADVVAAGIDVVLQFIAGVTSKLPEIIDTAFKLIISFINGLADAIRNNAKAIKDAVINLIDAVIGAIAEVLGLKGIYDKGKEMVQDFLDGTGKMLTELWDQGVKIGEEIINGITGGLSNMAKGLITKAKDVVGDAVDAVKNFLGIHSPSKVGTEIGEYFTLGMSNGIQSLASNVVKSSKSIGEAAVNSLSLSMAKLNDVVSGQDGDFNPTITPVIDMTNVDYSLNKMDKKFGEQKSINVGSVKAKAIAVSNQMGTNDYGQGTISSDSDSVSGATYVFNQNNYSPKPLSRLEIYRQTRNQFSMLKGMVTEQ